MGAVNYHLTSHHLAHYQSLRGTRKVEAVHSVLDRTFYAQCGIGAKVFDTRYCRGGGFSGVIVTDDIGDSKDSISVCVNIVHQCFHSSQILCA